MTENKETKNVFAEEEKILEQLFFKFEINGVKSLLVMEKMGEWSMLNSGVTGRAIIALIIQIAHDHPDFFAYALKVLEEAEETHEVPEGASVH